MTCTDFRSDFLAGDPTSETREHMATCADCRRTAEQLIEVRSMLADPMMWESPRSTLEDEVITSMLSGTHAVGHRPPGRSGRAPSMRWLVTAAAVAVVVFGVVIGSMSGGRPDWQLMVSGTDRAPEASAFVEGWDTDSGTRLRVTMAGLPPAPDGYVYELWMTQDRNHVSAGSFVEANGLEMQVGVRQSDYPRVWITLEALDGDTSPNWDQNLIDTEA